MNAVYQFLSSGRDRKVALKIVKSAWHYTEAARDEISILKKMSKEDPDNEMCVIRLVDSFEHYGPNGNRKYLVLYVNITLIGILTLLFRCLYGF